MGDFSAVVVSLYFTQQLPKQKDELWSFSALISQLNLLQLKYVPLQTSKRQSVQSFLKRKEFHVINLDKYMIEKIIEFFYHWRFLYQGFRISLW